MYVVSLVSDELDYVATTTVVGNALHADYKDQHLDSSEKKVPYHRRCHHHPHHTCRGCSDASNMYAAISVFVDVDADLTAAVVLALVALANSWQCQSY